MEAEWDLELTGSIVPSDQWDGGYCSSLPAGNLPAGLLEKPLNVGDSCMSRADCNGTRIYPYCLYCLFGNPFSVDGYLAQPR